MVIPIGCPENILDFIITTTNDEGIEILALTQGVDTTKSLKLFDYPSKLMDREFCHTMVLIESNQFIFYRLKL